MKGFVFAFLMFIGTSSYGLSCHNRELLQQVDTVRIIENIRKKFQEINAKEHSFQKATKDIFGQSSEGGQAEVYYDGDDLKKMIVTHYGEIGKIRTEYYVDDGAVFFIYVKRTEYDKPMHEKGSKVSSIEEDRYYFYQDKMIRWVDSSKSIVKPTSEIFQSKEKELLNATPVKFEE